MIQLESKRSLYQERRTTLISAAVTVTGKIDVRDCATAEELNPFLNVS
jgi:hypothetical protein